LVEEGEIDTIIVAITHMQGRLQGKRLDASYFFDELADGVVEGCSYLSRLRCRDMRTVDGFALTLGARLRRPRVQAGFLLDPPGAVATTRRSHLR